MTFLDVPGVKPGALDTSIQAKIEDTASATRGALNATYATNEIAIAMAVALGGN